MVLSDLYFIKRHFTNFSKEQIRKNMGEMGRSATRIQWDFRSKVIIVYRQMDLGYDIEDDSISFVGDLDLRIRCE
jgi:hypothetical protein